MQGPVDYWSQLTAPDPGDVIRQSFAAFQQQQIAQAAQARQVALQQQADSAQRAALADPTPQNIVKWSIAAPDQYQAVKSSHDMLTGDEQTQNLRDTSAMYGYLKAGNTDAAKSILQRRIDADAKAGHDTSDDQAMLDQIGKDPTQATGVVGMHLAATMGPDKFVEAYGKMGEEDRANAEERYKLDDLAQKPALTAAQTAQATAAAAESTAQADNIRNPKPETDAVTDPNTGEVKFYDKHAPPPVADTPKTFQNLAGAIEADENSSGDPSAKNPRSSATGNGQFINSTWLQTVKSARPDLAKGKSDAQILAMRSDPAISREITAANAQINAGALEASGVQANGATVAMAHKLGPGDAIKVSKASPDTPLKTLLSPRVLVANPQLAKLTAGQYYAGLTQKFGSSPIGQSPDNPNALTGDALDYVAQQYVSTGQLPPLGNGQIATRNRDAIINRAAQIEKETGSTGYDAVTRHSVLKATGESLAQITKMQGMIAASENTVVANMDIVKNLLPKGAGKTGSPLLNAPIQHLRKDVFGSADVAQFDGAIGTVADEYAKVMSSSTGTGGVTSDSARHEAYSRLSKAATPAQLLGVMSTMKQEMSKRTDALEAQRTAAQETIRNRGVAPKTQVASNGAPKVGTVQQGYRFNGGNPADPKSWSKVQ
jgi:hypothetical protein